MPMSKFGPGTLTMNPQGTADTFECQVTGGGVVHSYEEVQEQKDYLGAGCQEAARTERTDALQFDIDHDLYAGGLYYFSLQNDRTAVDFEYVPDTGMGSATPASWTGTVEVRLPDGVQGDEVGAFLSGSIEWTQSIAGDSGNFTFTPAADV